MKKNLLLSLMTLAGTFGFSQEVVFDVLTPTDIAGFKPVAYVQMGATGWNNVPNLLQPENAVTGELVIVRDGTAADSLGCEPLVNAADVNGKVAVVFRGACFFSLKAMHAFDAGAIAVMIVNNVPGDAPFEPGASGTSGENVNVPVCMTDFETGVQISSTLSSEPITAYIGVADIIQNDLVLRGNLINRALAGCIPAALAQSADEFSVPMGAAVINNGAATQNNLVLTATITFNGNEIYNETATAASVAPGDTITFSLPTFSQTGYEIGTYQTIYTVTADEEEQLPTNNTFDASFSITEDLYSLSTMNVTTQLPVSSVWATPATFTEFTEICAHFRNPNASRLALKDVSFSLWNTQQPITGYIADLTAYEWNNDFNTIQDLLDSPEDLIIEPWDFAVYQYPDNQNQQTIVVPWENQEQLQDNQRYLFCIVSTLATVGIGSAPNSVNYDYANVTDQPTTTVANAANFFLRGWASGLQVSLGITFDVLVGTSNVEKVDIVPFPNPTRDFITVPYKGNSAFANLSVFDLAGRNVHTERVNYTDSNVFQLNVETIPAGTYLFNLQFEDKSSTSFKVVIAK